MADWWGKAPGARWDERRVAPPVSEAELIGRLGRLQGRTLASLAAEQGDRVPADLRRNKGWVGQVIERALGASAGSESLPDFPALGIELKTLPMDARGRPRESTFVATLDPSAIDLRWEVSPVRKKLHRVAFVPIASPPGSPLGARTVGVPFLWSPSADQEARLRADYEDLIALVEEGFGEAITGHQGAALQLRPKGADSRSLRWTIDEEGRRARTAPRAFYLRAAFTHTLVPSSSA